MKRGIPLLLVLCFAGHLNGQVQRDKVLHFVGGALFGLAGAGIAKNATDGNRTWTFVGAVAGSVLAGAAKEAIDSRQPGNRWDNEDLLATVLGGVTVGLAIEIFSKKDNGRLRTSGLALNSGLPYQSPQLEFNVTTITTNNELPRLTPFGFSTNLLRTFQVEAISYPLP